MAFYKNQSDMFQHRAENCKKNGDRFYAQAMAAKENLDTKKYQILMAQSQTQYKMQKKNEQRAEENAGKEWDGTSVVGDMESAGGTKGDSSGGGFMFYAKGFLEVLAKAAEQQKNRHK